MSLLLYIAYLIIQVCLFIVYGDQTIKLYDVEIRESFGVMKGHPGSVKSLCFILYNLMMHVKCLMK